MQNLPSFDHRKTHLETVEPFQKLWCEIISLSAGGMCKVSGLLKVFVFGRRLRAHVMVLGLSSPSLSLRRVTIDTRVARPGQNMQRNTRFPLLGDKKSHFSKNKSWQNRCLMADKCTKSITVHMLSLLFIKFFRCDGCGSLHWTCLTAAFSLDLVRTWWMQWLSMPVSHCGDTDQQYLSIEMFFRIWLMCFLLTPVTHVCSGCCVLVNQIRVDEMLSLIQNARKIQLFEMTDEKMTKDDAEEKNNMFWDSFIYPFWCKRTGEEVIVKIKQPSQSLNFKMNFKMTCFVWQTLTNWKQICKFLRLDVVTWLDNWLSKLCLIPSS